jgi:hypothetical protein
LEKKFKECEKGDDITPFDGTVFGIRITVYCSKLLMMQFCELFFWLQEIPALPVTPLSFLRAMWEVSRVAAARYPTLFI